MIRRGEIFEKLIRESELSRRCMLEYCIGTMLYDPERQQIYYYGVPY